MNEQQQNLEHEEPAIRTGIQAGDGQVAGSGNVTSGGSDNDPSRGGGGTLGSGT